tara:strand:- start:2369 stop:3556 length:1188 start_codon:yes stop_codon:yes gene_type:complete
MTTTRTYAGLTDADLRKLVCVRCGEWLRWAWGGSWGVRADVVICGCRDDQGVPQEPQAVKQGSATRVARTTRLGRMVHESMADQEMAVIDENPETGLSTRPDEPMEIEVLQRRAGVRKFVIDEMQEDYHYGLIPGTPKKSLWEPGAEYLAEAFKIATDFEVVDKFEDFQKGEYRYTVRYFRFVVHPQTGEIIRVASHEATAWSKERSFSGKTEATTLPNLVLDKAQKRAFVNLIRKVTGTSGQFTDVLDGDDEPAAPIPEPTNPGPTQPHEPRNEDVPAQDAPEAVSSPPEVAAGGAPWGENDPLKACWVHGEVWTVNKSRHDSQPTYLSHEVPNEPWCKFGKLMETQLDALLGAQEDIGKRHEWLKSRFSGRTWSRLEPHEQYQAVRTAQQQGA